MNERVVNDVLYLDLDTSDSSQTLDVYFFSNDEVLDVQLLEEIQLDVDLTTSSQMLDIFLDDNELGIEVEMLGGDYGRYPYYTGRYVVDPRKVEQILATKEKSMTDDVIINPIFYAETSNISGGLTAVIGLE